MQNIENKKYYSVIILAAGKSKRLGFPKLSLKFTQYITFLEHIVNSYNMFGCKEIVIVINKEGFDFIDSNGLLFPQKTKLVVNEHPEWHRFYSLKLGAKSLNDTNAIFVQNVDNPFVNQDVLRHLLNNSDKAEYISPEFNRKGGHPFLISGKVIQDLKASKSDQMHLKEFLNRYQRNNVSVSDEKILVNINTLEEYKKYFGFE